MGGCERRRMPSPHLQFGLIGSSAKFGRWHSANQAPAEEPFVTLFKVVGVCIGDAILRNCLLRALRPHYRNHRTATQSERGRSQPATETTTCHGSLAHLPVSRVEKRDATQKRGFDSVLDHFGKLA